MRGRRRTKAKSIDKRRVTAARRKSNKPPAEVDSSTIQTQAPLSPPVKLNFWQKYQPQITFASVFITLIQLLFGDGLLRRPIEQPPNMTVATSRADSLLKVKMTSPRNGSVFTVGSPVTFEAVATAPQERRSNE